MNDKEKEKENENEEPSAIDEKEGAWSLPPVSANCRDFVTSMVHFYRGEVNRSNTWRTRLDTTTNWSVITTAAVLTFAFGEKDHTHVVILLSMMLIWLFLVSEARRYRYYELWALRVRLMETDFFSTLLQSGGAPSSEWAGRLVDSLLSPKFPISGWEALGRRLRRNYIWLFLILGLAWVLKLLLYPTITFTFASFVEHAAIGPVRGGWVVASVGAFFVVVMTIALGTAGLQASPGEVLSRNELLGRSTELFQSLARAASGLPFIPRRNQLAIVITEHADEVGRKLLLILKRGVTALEGTGMYSNQTRSVLFCAVAPSEVERLKAAVHAADENAFVVVNQAEQVLGSGFSELEPRWRAGRSKGNRGRKQ